MLIKILFVVLAIVAVILIRTALQSPDYRIARETTIRGSAEKLFPYLNNARLSNEWMPWKDIDPSAQMAYSGPDSGVGSRAAWTGGKQLGEGSSTIVESVPNQRVRMKLDYVKPFQMTQEAEFAMKPAQDGFVVEWSVQGKNTFMARLICGLFMNMDKMVGGSFEKGLANLKQRVESAH